MAHRDPVTPDLHAKVLRRDKEVMQEGGINQRIVCLAPVLDRSELGNCWGRTTIEHVKWELRAGRRAKSRERYLVCLCEGHTEAGAKAGFQWNTARRNRAKTRAWLIERYGVVDHED